MAGSVRSTYVASRDRQSIFTARPGLATTAMSWSMMPVGTPANSCSARWQSRALSLTSHIRPDAASTSVATATSSAALLDNPAPTGTSDSMTRSRPGTVTTDRLDTGDDTGRVVRPVPRAWNDWTGKVERDRLVEGRAVHRDRAIEPRPGGDSCAGLNRHRQHEPIGVVGVLADEIDAARRRREPCRRLAKTIREADEPLARQTISHRY